MIAIIAMKRMIIPLMPEDYSAVAVSALFERVYGTADPEENSLMGSMEMSFEYKSQLKKYKNPQSRTYIEMPQVEMVIMNRVKYLPQGMSKSDFGKTVEIMKRSIFELFKDRDLRQRLFAIRGSVEERADFWPVEEELNWKQSQDKVLRSLLFFMRDMNNAGSMSITGGLPVTAMRTLKFDWRAHFNNSDGANEKSLEKLDSVLTYIASFLGSGRMQHAPYEKKLSFHDWLKRPSYPRDGPNLGKSTTPGKSQGRDDDDDDYDVNDDKHGDTSDDEGELLSKRKQAAATLGQNKKAKKGEQGSGKKAKKATKK